LLAGLAAWVCGEAAYGLFKPVYQLPANWDRLSAFDKPDVLSTLLRNATPGAEAKNTAVAYGLLGLLLPGLLGLAGGLTRRSPRAALAAMLVGDLAGAGLGIGLSVAMTHLFFHYLDPESGLMLGLLIHAGIWVPIGAAAGLAFGIGLGGRRSVVRALLGGIAGAVLATMAFEVAHAIAFPLARLEAPVPPERLSRLLSMLCVSMFTALGAAVGVRERH
jgi:hypothetical protein